LRTPETISREETDEEGNGHDPQGLASRVGGARPAWENVVAQTETGAGVLRPRWRFQRTRRSDQRTVGTPTRHRPRLPQLRPLRPAPPDPLRTTHRENQSTLKPEEPDKYECYFSFGPRKSIYVGGISRILSR